MYELIITEKPAASQKIAEALADGKAIKESKNGVPYYKITHGKQDIVVACAVGHLYGLEQKDSEGKKWSFPVFEVEWVPTSERGKGAEYTKKYLNVIKQLAKDATTFTIATDYDIEGEVIGLNVIRYACKKKDARRMKFSTLTKDELIESYENASPHLDWGQAEAGETRHKLDWFYGINTSRALTSAIKSRGAFKIMSTGRVQGPSLKIIVDREKEIKAFKPVPFWQIELTGTAKESPISAWHEADKFWKKEEADKVMQKVNGEKKAIISEVEKAQFKQMPPVPFDLTSLQIEAHRCLGISPKDTLAIAQDLYIAGSISYPRTSSQQLSPKIGFHKILTALSKQKEYQEGCSFLLKKSTLQPNNGKKTDPAHPAIYPTGIAPKGIEARKLKIYDLIVHRFMATFGDPAVRQTIKVKIDCRQEIFIAKGITTLEPGWHKLYGKYAAQKEEELPAVNKGDTVNVKKITLHEKETQPPKRYTEASIIKELERRNLGTKATRAAIIDTLFQRGYTDGKPIVATELGIRTSDTLSKYSPTIVDEELTRHFELEMDEIRERKKKEDEVLGEAKVTINKIVDDFKKHEKEIGKDLLEATRETRDALSFLGKCPACKEGDLQIRRGKFGQFAACNKYPNCKTTFSLPGNALIKPAKKQCEKCGYPMVIAIKKAKRPREFCLNPNCETKYVEESAWKEAKEVQSGEVEKECPKCKKGHLVVRRSIYGTFYGCSGYPSCKYTEKIQEGPLKEDFGKKPAKPSKKKKKA